MNKTKLGKEKVSHLIPFLSLIAEQNGLRLDREREFKVTIYELIPLNENN